MVCVITSSGLTSTSTLTHLLDSSDLSESIYSIDHETHTITQGCISDISVLPAMRQLRQNRTFVNKTTTFNITSLKPTVEDIPFSANKQDSGTSVETAGI